jgi:hypothetical protein
MYEWARSTYPDAPAEQIPANKHPREWPILDSEEKLSAAVEKFVESDYFLQLKPIEGSIEGLRILKSDGHAISVISNIGEMATERLIENFHRIDTAFVPHKIVCIGLHELKIDMLNEIKPDVFVDNGIHKITDSLKVDSIKLRMLFDDHTNASADLKRIESYGIKIVENWRSQIVQEIRILAKR